MISFIQKAKRIFTNTNPISLSPKWLDVAHLINENNYQICAEIGVWKGDLSFFIEELFIYKEILYDRSTVRVVK